jgi:ribosomal protein S18 acetylase RimI-like enzyme
MAEQARVGQVGQVSQVSQVGQISVCRVDESTWRLQRTMRLNMLQQAPRAFGSRYAEAAARSDEEWVARTRLVPTWVALRDGEGVGSVGMARWAEQPPDETSLVGMWVEPAARGLGIGELLVRTVLAEADRQGLSRVVLDVAHENGPAVGLYRRMGFTPTGRTSALPWDRSITELEMEYVLRRQTPGCRLELRP